MPPKEENNGLLSKVVRFVKNPLTSWAELDHPEADRESGYSKQMLKEMIERKRRNDFVRKREFDMLRKMRRSEVMAGQDPLARPSFFQSSMPSRPDDRASTLKKIDEIEAQMSMQWWKNKHGDKTSDPSSTNFPLSSEMPIEASTRPPVASPAPRSTSYTRTSPQSLPEAPKPNPQESAPLLDTHLPGVPVPVQPAGGRHAAPPAPRAATPLARPEPVPEFSAVTPLAASASDSTASTGFGASKLFAIDVGEFAHDPELEEAAIRFANGDDAGAEAGLVEVLGPKGSRNNHEETWMALFDLYRATGQQDRFEDAAIDFAGRFGRSAPQWFAIGESVGAVSATAASRPPLSAANASSWAAPALVGTQTLAALDAALSKSPSPWSLDWSRLNEIDEAAVPALTALFTHWSSQPVQLLFIGTDRLDQAIKTATRSGDRDVSEEWWKLRMEVLRVMRKADEFELVALDYCVTYEVSPPSWERARCDFRALAADGSSDAGAAMNRQAFSDSMPSVLPQSEMPSTAGVSSQLGSVSTIALSGQVLGDANADLAALEDKRLAADTMVIDCASLIRVDFSAAGTLLNWVTARQAEGRQVQFVDAHRLVAAFFSVIGISEHARVVIHAD